MARLLNKFFYPSTFQVFKAAASMTSYSRVYLKKNPLVNAKIQSYGFTRFFSQDTEKMIVDYDYVKKSTSDDKVYIIDVREPEEIKEHGKIPNSVNIPLGNVSTVLGPMSDKEFEKTYNRSKPAEEAEIIFYCMIGKRSGMAQQNAHNLGYKNVKNYVGSWTDWAAKVQ